MNGPKPDRRDRHIEQNTARCNQQAPGPWVPQQAPSDGGREHERESERDPAACDTDVALGQQTIEQMEMCDDPCHGLTGRQEPGTATDVVWQKDDDLPVELLFEQATVVLLHRVPNGGQGDRGERRQRAVSDGIERDRGNPVRDHRLRSRDKLLPVDIIEKSAERRDRLSFDCGQQRDASRHPVRLDGNEDVSWQGRTGIKGGSRVVDEYHRPGRLQRLAEQRIARRSAERRRAGMVEAVIDSDGRGPGLMDGSNDLGEHGPVERCPKTRFAVRITDDDG